MTTGIVAEFNNLDERRYERVNELLNLYQNPPKGLLLHSAGPIPGGWRVVDIWESREAFDQFFKDRLSGALKQAGVTEPPTKQDFFPIHNAYAPKPNLLSRLTATVESR